jgi:hypothetical protein
MIVSEMIHCLPQMAQLHFLNLRNERLENGSQKLQIDRSSGRAEAAAKGSLNSGRQLEADWKLREAFLNSQAEGYVEDALETCRLYDIPITQELCKCLEQSAREYLTVQFQYLKNDPEGGVSHIETTPPSARQQLADMATNNMYAILRPIQIKLEQARVTDLRNRTEMSKNDTKQGHTYIQNNVVNGAGTIAASQLGDVYYQSSLSLDFDTIKAELSSARSLLKQQPTSLDNEEYIGLLAGAEKAAEQKNPSVLSDYLKQIPEKGWDIIKVVAPQLVLHYLKLKGMA